MTHYYLLARASDGRQFYAVQAVSPEVLWALSVRWVNFMLFTLRHLAEEISRLAGDVELTWTGYVGEVL